MLKTSGCAFSISSSRTTRVALAPHGLGQLAALVVADVAGRGTDQARHVVTLHELAHVDLDERVLGAEHELGERLRELGLPDAGGAHEDERADRPLRVLQAGARASHRPADRLDRLLLADDAVVERILHVEQALGLLGADADDRDPGPHAHDLRDVLVGDDRRLLRLLLVPLGTQGLDRLLALGLLVAQSGGGFVVLPRDRLVLAAGDLHQLALGGLDLGRGRRRAQADARAGLVDEVDRLVRQRAVGDVANAQVDRGAQRLVADLDLVVLLVALADPEQDLDRLVDGRLLDHDRLEAALERRVLLDVLAELVERRGADALELAARQRRLEDVRRVDGALGRAGTDERVELVDEQDAVASWRAAPR